MSALALHLNHRTVLTSGLTNSSSSTSSSTSDEDYSQDRLAAQIAMIMQDVRKELSCSHKSNHRICKPEKLAQRLDVFQNAIQRNGNLVTEEEPMMMQHFTMHCMSNYTREHRQLSNRFSLAIQKSRHDMTERDNAIQALENQREFPELDQRTDLSQTVKELASVALAKIKKAFETRTKCLNIEKERMELFSSLLILNTRLLVHPWAHEKTFQATFRQIKAIILDFNSHPSQPISTKPDASPIHPTTLPQTDNLADQISRIMTEIRQELECAPQPSSEKYRVRPDQLAEMLEVFKNAIQNNANQVSKKTCDEMLKFVDYSMAKYASENRQFSDQFSLAVNENWDRMLERAKRIKALKDQMEDSQIHQLSEVQNLASRAINKIHQATKARAKLMHLAEEGIGFLTALKKLKTVMLAHPWYHFDCFQSALREIQNIETVGKLDEAEWQRSSGLFSPRIKNN